MSSRTNSTPLLGHIPEEKSALVESFLKEHYGMIAPASGIQKFLEPTASSNVFFCKTDANGPVVIKESFWYADTVGSRTARDALAKAYEVSEALRSRGVRFPKCFRTVDDRFVVSEGGYETVVLQFIDGIHFDGTDREFASSGQALGALHREGTTHLRLHPGEEEAIGRMIPVEKPYEESRALFEGTLRERLLTLHHCSVPEVCAAVREHIALMEETMRFIDASGINDASRSRGILHNDFGSNNGLFAEDGTFLSFLDIDQIGIGPHIWDVGNTLASFIHSRRGRDACADIEKNVRLFLRAYHKEFPLPLEEYTLCLAATQRWDMMRSLRSLRRHHYEEDRLSGLLPKLESRVLPRMREAPRFFSFLNEAWIRANVTE